MNAERLLEHFDRLVEAPGAVPRLRRFILDLAVRGKLVEQDSKDEPAVELLKRINADKSRMAKAGSIRREQPFAKIDPESLPFQLPAHWTWVRLGEVIELTGGQHLQPGEYSHEKESGPPYITGPADFGENGLLISRYAVVRKAFAHAGQILLTVKGAGVGKTAVCDLPVVAISRQLMAIAPIGWDAGFLTLVTDRLSDSLKAAARSLIPGISREDVQNFVFAMPPLSEQRRIVSKVDELMALCDRLEAVQAERERRRDRLAAASLDRLIRPDVDAKVYRADAHFHLCHLPRFTVRPDQISALRQTVLNLAVRGRLVRQDPNDEPAAATLGNRQIFLTATDCPWPLTPGWAWSTVGKIGTVFGGGTPSKADPSFWKGAIPWVSPKDMKTRVIRDAQDHITELAIESSSTRLIPAGALLLVVRGMILAHSFPTALTEAPVTINQDMKAIVPFRQDFGQMLLLVTMGMKPEVLRLVQHSTHGTCKLLTDDLFRLPIPIPPVAEQRRIVAKVDDLMAACDRLELQLTTVHSESRRLLEAVLHEAIEPAIMQ